MLDAMIFKGWSMRQVARFTAALADRALCGWRPKIAHHAIEQCHRAADGYSQPNHADLSAAETITEAYTSPRWELISSVLAVGYWAMQWQRYELDGPAAYCRRREAADYCLKAAGAALDEADRAGVNAYALAALYLGMRYRFEVHPDYRDAALAALVAGHAEVADDIMRRGSQAGPRTTLSTSSV